jgi:hypothetical protein
MSNQQIATAYIGAVLSSCTIAIGLGKYVQYLSRQTNTGIGVTLLKNAVPYLAVASAGAFNVLLMRSNEISEGIAVKDVDGNILGTSCIAGKRAITEVMLTRIALPAPILLIPPFLMNLYDRTNIAKSRPMFRSPVYVAVTTVCLWLALPAAIGLFPQHTQINAMQLEPQFHHLTNQKGQPIDKIYFNKGL